MKKVLVIAAHPDDEVLGCGATIARHAQLGDEVHVVIMAEGATSRDEKRDREHRSLELSGLAESAHRAKDILGINTLILHDFPDNRMDSVDLLDIVKVVEHHIERVRPEIVYTHHVGDVNIDHRRIHEAVITACRPQPLHPVKTLLFFEIPSSTEWQTSGSAAAFLPNWFVDVSKTIELKMEALEIYDSEVRQWPHSRSIKAIEYLARWRGACVGCNAVEAFMVGRHIEVEAYR